MKIFDQERWVQVLADRPLLRMLFFEFWFRLAVISFLVLIVFLALFLSPIWRTSPAGFIPIIRTSGLALVQAWSLKRTARKADLAGRNTEASYAWQAAIHHNVADTEALRGVLQQDLKEKPVPQRLGDSIGICNWLLRLTGTNLNQVALVAKVYEHYRLFDMLVELLESQTPPLPPELEAAHLKALFNRGMIDRFIAVWKEGQGRSLPDPELPIYYAAYQAAWGPTEGIVEGRQKLQTAVESPQHHQLANRLSLAVAAHWRDQEGYAKALNNLEKIQSDQLSDHVGFWYLLAAQGETESAAQLARAYNRPPASATETVQLAEALQNLGLKEQALLTLRDFVPQYDYSVIGWLTHARLLMVMQRWDDLRALALKIREESAMREHLTDYSYYLEGRAELGLGKTALAESAFNKVTQFQFALPGLGLAVVSDLIRLGYPEPAKKILAQVEKAGTNNLQYWILAARTAYELKESSWLLATTSRAYDLNPHHLLSRNYYAAALLVLREKPAEAINLTLQLLNENPQLVGLRLNHILALLLNQRATEAGELLRGITPDNLNPEELNSYFEAKMELHAQLGQPQEALSYLRKLDRQLLFPCQIARIDELQKKLTATSEH